MMQFFDVDRPLIPIRMLLSETLLATLSHSRCPLLSPVILKLSVPLPLPPVSTPPSFPTFPRSTSTTRPTLDTVPKPSMTTPRMNDSLPLPLSVPTLPSRQILIQSPLLPAVENPSLPTILSPLPVIAVRVAESHSETTDLLLELVSFNATLKDTVLAPRTRSHLPTFNRLDRILRTEQEQEEDLYHLERRLLVIRCQDNR